MQNPYQTYSVKILKVQDEALGSKLFNLSFPFRNFKFQSGQFVQVSVPGFGEMPISICSDPSEKKYFQVCVRAVGAASEALNKFKAGERISVRGPYGHGFPIDLAKKRNLLIIAGGCGIEPLRPLIFAALNNPKKFQKVQIFYGAKSKSDLLFVSEYAKWAKNIDFQLTLDKAEPGELAGLSCGIGNVTVLFDCVKLLENSIAFLCGPPVMYKFVLEQLKKHGFKDEDIFLSLERRMHCAIGVCQHCAIGSKYVCKDGPVFSYAELKGVEGLF